MAVNQYEQALEDLEPEGGGPSQPANPYLETLDSMESSRRREMQQAQTQAVDSTPDRTAEAIKIGRQLGLPTDVVERNFDTIKKRAAIEGSPYGEMLKDSPTLAQWTTEPENAKVAHDDLENLGALEWLLTAPGRAFASGIDQVRFGRLKTESLFRELSQEEKDRLNSYKFGMEKGGAFGAGDSWFRKAVSGGAQQLPNLFGAGLYGAKYAAAGAAEMGLAGAGVGAVLGEGVGAVPGAVAGAGYGARAGMLYGAAKFGFELEAGNAYDEYQTFKDEHGNPLDDDVARMAAIATGGVNAALEGFGFEALLESVPGLKKLGALGTRSAVKKALLVPTVRQALKELAVSYGKTMSAEVATEVAQRATTILSGELAKTASGQDIPHRSASSVLEDLTNEGLGAVQSFAFTVAAGPALHMGGQIAEAKRAEQTSRFFSALGQQVGQSKLTERLPEKMQEFVERVTKDGPLENVYIPADSWVTYWQSQGLEPGAVAKELLGSSDALEQAQRDGTDLVIPTGVYAARLAGTSHNAALADELRLAPDQMNAREARIFQESLKALSQAEQVPESQVRASVLEQLTKAGVPDDVAAKYADTFDAFIGQQADVAGVSPEELLAGYGIQIKRQTEAQATAPAPVEARQTPAAETAPLGTEAAPASEGVKAPASDTAPGQVQEEIPGLAALEDSLKGTELELVTDEQTVQANGSGDSAASLEATSRLEGMRSRGEQFGVFDRAGRFRPVIGPEAVDYNPQRGETFGVLSGDGFRVLTDNGGKVPDTNQLATGSNVGNNEGVNAGTEAGTVSGADAAAAPGAEAGLGLRDGSPEQSHLDTGGSAEAASDGSRAERRRLPAPEIDELFVRKPAEENAARFTEETRRELARIVDELDANPFVGRTWHWLDNPESADYERGKRGNAAGGNAIITAGNAGAEVYHDIIAYAPVGKVTSGKRKGQPAREASGSRSKVESAVRQMLETGDIRTGLQEGAMRVAERRAIDDYSVISRPELPPSWGREASRLFTDTLDAAIEDELHNSDMLDVDAMESDILEPDAADVVDTSFDPSEFNQGLFDNLEEEQLAKPGAKTDVLETGEQQPRLPGAENVREQDIQTPEFDAPFSLTAPIAKSSKGRQTTLFQDPAAPKLESPAFREWFGDSKVTDAEGKPLEVYHGTPGGWFDTFEMPDGVAFFTDSLDTASSYSGTERISKPGTKKAGNLAVYLSLKNPLIVDFGGNHYDGYIADSYDQSDPDHWTDLTLNDAIDDAKRAGHDGVIATNIIAQGPEGSSWSGAEPSTVYVAFAPGQIKSAENVGGFSTDDERILYQTAYHGSPHLFEEFSLQHIGTGEGAQAYGWGLYFASRRETAAYYRDVLSENPVPLFKALTPAENEAIPAWIRYGLTAKHLENPMDRLASDIADFKQRIADNLEKINPTPRSAEEVARLRADGWGDLAETPAPHAQPWLLEAQNENSQQIINVLEKLQASGSLEHELPPTGRLFVVDIPEDDRFLSWDLPLSQQSPHVQAALRQIGLEWKPFKTKTAKQLLAWLEGPTAQALAREDIGIRESLRQALLVARNASVARPAALEMWQWQHQGYFRQGRVDMTGESAYSELQALAQKRQVEAGVKAGQTAFNADDWKKRPEWASRLLADHGIAGIRYLDGGSRSLGGGSQNYVVFDDRLVTVKEFFQEKNPNALTNDDVVEFGRSLVEQFPGVAAVDLYLNNQGDIKLDTLAVTRGAARQGLGSKVMGELTKFADRNGRRIILSLAQKGYEPIEGGIKTTSSSRLEKFYRRFGFVKNAGRYKDFTIREGMYREPTLVPGREAETGQVITDTQAFRNWFGDSKIVDEAGKPLRVYHGTTADFEAFSRDKANIESDFGGGFYFSNTTDDVDSNYAGIGPDLEQKIELEAERIAAETDREYNDPDVIQEARKRFMDHEGATIPVYLRIEKPAIFGGDSPTFLSYEEKYEPLSTFDEADVQELRDEGMDDYEIARELSERNYYEPELVGTLPAFLEALERVSNQFHDGDASEAIDRIREEGYGGGLTVEKALELWKGSEQTAYFTDDRGVLAQSEIFRQALEDAGFDGIIDNTVDKKFGSQRRIGKSMAGMHEGTVHYIAFSPTSVKSALGNTTFDANDPRILKQEKRGAIRFGRNRQVTISLFEKADLSTFLHESGHLFLEIAGDLADKLAAVNPETLTDKQRRFLSDYAGILTYLGVENREGIQTEHHEKFARSFEAYLAEGKAPTVALQGAFSSFRAWLLGVYRALKNLNVTLTPEVRGVFDRLLASDAAIAEAQQRRGVEAMFTDAASAGMSEQDFALYRDTVAQASRTAREKLDARLMAEVRRQQEESYRARRDEVQAEVETAVHQEPVYQALSAIRNGTQPNGDPLVEGLETAPLRLDRGAIADRYGKDRLKRLPPATSVKEGGLDPEAVAPMFGFSSGDELLTAIENAPPMKQLIEQKTGERMIREFGSLLLDGSLAEAAQASIANEDRDAIIRAELRALNQLRRTAKPFVKAGEEKLAAERRERAYERRWFEAEAKLREAIAAGKKQVIIDELENEVKNLRQKARGGAAVINAAIPPMEVINENAKARIAAMKIGSINPSIFWSASRRAGQQAIERAARQDFEGAIQAKQQELVNLALYREAERALEDVKTRVKFAKDLGKPAARARLGLAGTNYQDQVDGILDAYEFAKVPAKALERRASLARFLAGLEAAGLPVPDDMPAELLEEQRRTNYQNLTVEELVGVTDGLKMIVHLARLKAKLLKAQDEREFAEVRQAVVDSIREHSPTVQLPAEFGAAEDRKRKLADWFASHSKISQLAQALDGYVDGGPVWTNIIKPLNDAANEEATRNATAGEAYRKILADHYTADERGAFGVKTFIPAIGGSLSKEARLAVALNWGNETSRDRLTNDPRRKWNRQQVEAILATLDKRDWDFVQATFDYLDTFWPDIAAKQERVTGVAPEKVEAATIKTAFGDYRGGYYPLMYDSRLNVRSAQLEAASEAKTLLRAAFVSSTTKRGHIEQRKSNVKLSVRLDLGVAFQHVQQVIHDLTHHEVLSDVQRILRDPAVSNAILETKGDLVYQQFTRALQDIAAGNVNGPRPTVLDKAATFARQGTQLSLLGLNLWTAAQQPLGLFNGMSRVGVKWVARGMRRWMRDAAHMENTVRWINEVSPMMRHRLDTATQDLSDLRLELKRGGGWFDKMVRKVTLDKLTQSAILEGYLWHIGLMQRVADVPTWLGQYEKSKEAGETEERAIALADQAVLDSQGGGQIKDLAQVQRGGPVARLFMTFYSYGNTIFNATARAAGKTNFKSPVSVLEFMGHMGLLYAMPALAAAALARATGRDGGDDDGLEDYFIDASKEMLSSALNTMVGIRELAGLVPGRSGEVRGYSGPAGARVIQLAYALGHQAEQGELDEAFFKAANRVGGILFSYPSAQLERTIDGYMALEEGRTNNPAALLFGGPPKNQK